MYQRFDEGGSKNQKDRKPCLFSIIFLIIGIFLMMVVLQIYFTVTIHQRYNHLQQTQKGQMEELLKLNANFKDLQERFFEQQNNTRELQRVDNSQQQELTDLKGKVDQLLNNTAYESHLAVEPTSVGETTVIDDNDTNIEEDDAPFERLAMHLVFDTTFEQLKTNMSEPIKNWRFAEEPFGEGYDMFSLSPDGDRLTIHQEGDYLIYSQMTFFDRSGRWGYAVHLDSSPVLKCLDFEQGMLSEPGGYYYNTVSHCHTSRSLYIREDQVISIWSLYPLRQIYTDSDLSFFGLVQI